MLSVSTHHSASVSPFKMKMSQSNRKTERLLYVDIVLLLAMLSGLNDEGQPAYTVHYNVTLLQGKQPLVNALLPLHVAPALLLQVAVSQVDSSY